MAWGPDLLVVQAKSLHRTKEVASQLEQLGFKPIEDEDDAYAGMLSLSRNPDAVREKITLLDISRRRWDEQFEPLMWAGCATGFLTSGLTASGRSPSWFTLLLGAGFSLLFVWDAMRIWGWRLEILPQGLRIRRYFRWSMIPWEKFLSVDSVPAGMKILPAHLRAKEMIVVSLRPGSSERLGTFGFAFARNLRNRLREEIKNRQVNG